MALCLQSGWCLFVLLTLIFPAVAQIAPDLILTQDLCQVCAPSGNEVSQLLKRLPSKPRILWQTPKTLTEIFECMRELGEATGRAAEGDRA